MSYCGIVILNYNTPTDTINCVDSVLKYNTAAIKIIIVDNASSDDSVKLISEQVEVWNRRKSNNDELRDGLPLFSLISAERNLGYARGNNLGIELLRKDPSVNSIMILNSDILFVEDIIPALLLNLHKKNASVVSPVLYRKDLIHLDYNCARRAPSFFQIWLHFFLSAHEPKFLKNRRYLLKNGLPDCDLLQVELPSGSCMLFRKELCEQIRIFDPNTFLYYEENIIAAQISRNMCGAVYVDTRLKCVHLGATSTKKTSSRFVAECEVQSALYYVDTFVSNYALRKIFHITCKFYLMLDIIKRKLKKIGGGNNAR